MKVTRTKIEWRVKSQASYLPKADKAWGHFCTIEEPGNDKHGAVKLVLQALNNAEPTPPKMEYRIKS